MIKATSVRKGMIIKHEGELFEVRKTEHITPGKGNALMVFLKRKMPKGDLFFSSGGIGDNSLGVEHRKNVQFQNKIEGKNYRLIKKDRLQVRVTDSSLFASWTVPIALHPNYVLPPASILIKGYGGVKTTKSTLIGASGYQYKNESNYFNAFVTFMHPLSKYSGPGTDGLFFRDLIANTIPPEKETPNPKIDN